jgi:hypothetical protein
MGEMSECQKSFFSSASTAYTRKHVCLLQTKCLARGSQCRRGYNSTFPPLLPYLHSHCRPPNRIPVSFDAHKQPAAQKKNGEPIPTEPLLEAVRRCSPTLRLGRPQRERCGGQAQPDIRTAQMSPNNRIATNTVIKIQLFRPNTLSRTAYSSRSHSTTDRTQIIGYLPQNKHALRHSAKRRREKEADSPEALQYLRDELDQLNELRSEDVRDYMASELDEDMEDTFSDGNVFGDTAAVASADSEKEVATKAFQLPTRWVPWRCASCRTFCASY